MAEIRPSSIDGVFVVRPSVHRDDRGSFVETYRRAWFPAGREMVQSNRAERSAGTVVGLHYHLHQTDYWYVMTGHARVVLHDLRVDSPTDGATLVLDLGPLAATDHDLADQDLAGVYIPPGVAHGFAALTDVSLTYHVDEYYDPADELGVAWDDPEIAADWGVAAPVLSARDQANPTRASIPPSLRPHGPHA